jgi:hypothetical protein
LDPLGAFSMDLLDINSEEDVSSYEKALYKAFSSRGLVEPVRIADHELHRTRSKIPYQSQSVFVAKVRNKVVASMAINYDMDNILQLELRGFSIDKKRPKICEVLHLFSLMDMMNGQPLIATISKYALEKIKARGVETVFATCAERRLNSYKRIGLSAIAENNLPINGSKYFLLEMNLPKGQI